jgi:NifU-like protein involved in Fe-S cluster formation
MSDQYQSTHYSKTVLEHFKNPHNVGRMSNPSIEYQVKNPISGDSLHLFLSIDNEKITQASFLTSGGPASIATASVATDLIIGMTLFEAEKITRYELVEKVGGLPPSKIQCSVIAAAAIRNAISKWKRNQNR